MKRLAPTGSDVATNPGTKPGSDIVPKLAMYGSGFLIDSRGTLVTNFHVGGKCKEIKVPALSSKGTLLAGDAANDLAVLKIESAPKNSVRLSTPSKIRQGQDIVVFGFPLEGYLPSAGNVTTGLITSLFGTNNNTSLIQISAPVQQGNSGGPVLDDKGDVVGVVSSKADAIRIAKATGDIVQNVNFAISLGTLQAFLDANRIEYQKPAYFAFTKKPDELAAEAREYTYKVECWR
jgi:S1-C subfamily serine protease